MSRRSIFDVAVVGLVAGVTGLASSVPAVGATTVALGSVVALATGILVHGKQQAAAWRWAWLVVLAGFALLAGHEMTSVPGPLDHVIDRSVWTLLGVTLLVAAVLWLLHQREPGCAGDAAWQAVLAAAALGFVAWALLTTGDALPGTGARIIAMTTALMDLVALWLLARLVSLTGRYPAAYRYVIAGVLCLFTVHAASAAGSLTGQPMPVARLNAIELWAYALLAAGALHLSMRTRFESVPIRSRPPGTAQLAAAAAVAVLGPLVLGVSAGTGRHVAPATVAGAALLPLLVVVRLVRQVRERSSAEYRAQHDALTGLPNRTLLDDRLSEAIAHAGRSGESLAVMFLDLDRFKNINDSLGHHVGNQLLQAVAQRIRVTLREEDTVARFGGDEFVVLLAHTRSVVDRDRVARKLLAIFDGPFPVDGRELVTSTSIGVAVFPDDGEDGETLIKHADTAMYRAKAAGRGTVQHYTRDMSARARVRQSIESNLHAAIDRGELTMHYQPKLSLDDMRVTGVEALARWWQPKLGFISPAAFIPVAEESGLILSLGEWALHEAFRQGRAWQEEGLPAVPVAVNMSARQFLQQDAGTLVWSALSSTGFDPRLAELELTETIFFRDFARIRESLDQLKQMGVRCSIDDFGTGFSGMQYLAKMRMDALKIDRSFVSAIGTDSADTAIVQAIIALAHSLDMAVVAEGVETFEQATYLRQLGCDEMQGFFISPPMAAEEMTGFLRHELLATAPIRRLEPRTSGIASDTPATTAGFDAFELQMLLLAACTDTDDRPIDLDLVGRVLSALQAAEPRVGGAPWSHSIPMRVAVGTLAGLVPLSGGMAAAGTLPPSLQEVAAQLLERGGIEIPTHDPPFVEVALASAEQMGVGEGTSSVNGAIRSFPPDPAGAHAVDAVAPATDPASHPAGGDKPSAPGRSAQPGRTGRPPDAGRPTDPGPPSDPATSGGAGPPADPGRSGDAGPPADPGRSGDAGPPADPGRSGDADPPADHGPPADPGSSGQAGPPADPNKH
jgi:diguanylate cyclase (GGDEF)-like protein